MTGMTNQTAARKSARRLSLREGRLIRALADPQVNSIAEALRVSGYPDSAISSMPDRSIGGPSRGRELAGLMDLAGITDERLMRTLNAGLDATKVVRDLDDVPDYAVRHKYLDAALRLKDILAPEKPEKSRGGAVFVIEGLGDG